ncbi:thioredoxin domain-containing protein [Nocardioides sp. GY 10113]|uniref:thioredoxin domain-containing protein n=1 Tax=Nocardioides sp. GY 10113 TaxID=2569761 RepID=UPI0010A7E93B|nr:thioredoxin domain-containing protein [Nocardioides sp. GY 10113]TIC83233.1 thioredoxin domain-containing protein [Nocardioides sp. GY 10113]
MPNRLASATSPYLLQHADNPVDWWEWGPEAFEEARRRNVPVIVSVGYAACHWCHVMAHESFEDEATAALMNERFVNIKVDREERPDVDAVYMQATTALTGNGGWPMTVVVDHDGAPFFAGTYFPDQPRHGQPAFTQVLTALAQAWSDRGEDVRTTAGRVAEHLAKQVELPSYPLDAERLTAAVARLAGDFDPMAGGFGDAPKFPPTMVLEFLRRVADAGVLPAEQEQRARHMLARTTAAMAGGGIYDQLGGGFARYAVDRGWVVPHFEKMLYDNAQLIGLCARLGTEQGTRVATETADFLLRELRTAEGGFASSLDADSLVEPGGESKEGAFYAWTPAQLVDALGEERGRWAAELFAVTEAGTFDASAGGERSDRRQEGTSTLQLRHAPTDPRDVRRLAEVRARLLDARGQRPRPARDDKVVAAWNGLAISGLCDLGRRTGRPEYVAAARAAAELLERVHLVPAAVEGVEGVRLLRVSREGVAGPHAGVLEDYGCVASGFLALAQATADPRWLRHATDLIDAAVAGFAAPDGGFHDTHADAEALIARPRDPGDNASPSGFSSLVHALLEAHALTGEGRYRDVAEAALATAAVLVDKAPRFAGWTLAAATAALDGPLEVAVVGPPGDARDALESRALALPGAVVVAAAGPVPGIALLQGRQPVDGHPAAYVCRGQVCERPVTDPDLVAVVRTAQ